MIRRTLAPVMMLVAAAALAGDAMTADTERGTATTFTVRIENVSTTTTLRSKSGATAPAPNSPGLWVIHDGPAPLFEAGKHDLGWGLEAQAEDGDPATLAAHCSHHAVVRSSGVFNTPVGDEKPGPALPGRSYEFTVSARPGERLSLVTMFGQSNDLFYAPGEQGIALFDAQSRPARGDLTSQLRLWDAGTEANQEPGFGADQAPRQKAPNTGAPEKRAVGKPRDGFRYPRVTDVLRVTLTPAVTMANH